MTRTQLLHSFLFLALTLGVLTAASTFLNYCYLQTYATLACEADGENREVKIKLLMEHQLDPELMIFGSSVALVHYDANLIEKQTGLSTFNMGLNGNFFPENYGFIREFLSYSENSKIILMSETYGALWRHEGLHRPEYTFTWIENENVYDCLYKMDPMRVFSERYVPFYNLTTVKYWMIRQGLENAKLPVPKMNLELCNKGYKEGDNIWLGPKATGDTIHTFIEEEVVSDFKEVIGEIIAAGKTAVLVMPPVYDEGAKLIPRLDEAREVFQSLCEPEGAYFLDYSRDPEFVFKVDWFTNNTHLNPMGAKVLSERISEDLKQFRAVQQ